MCFHSTVPVVAFAELRSASLATSSAGLRWIRLLPLGLHALALLVLGGCLTPEDPCPAGQVEEDGLCVSLACSEVRWEELKEEGYLVAPGGTGDGTSDAPFGSISEALAVHPRGPLVLAEGLYEEFFLLGPEHDGLRVEGRCAERVRIEAFSFGEQTSLTVGLPGSAVSVEWNGTTFAGADADGIRVLPDAQFRGQDIRVEAFGHDGVNVLGGAAVIQDSVVVGRELSPRDISRRVGRSGAYCSGRGTLELRDVVVLQAERQGIFAVDCDVNLERVSVLDTEKTPLYGMETPDNLDFSELDVEDGIGLALVDGTILGSSITIERARTTGIAIYGAQGQLDDVVVRDTLPKSEDGTLGTGLMLVSGAHLEGKGFTLTGNYRTGIVATSASALLDDVTIRESLPEESTQRYGRGIEVGVQAQLEFTDLYIGDCYDLGLVVDASDVRVERGVIERIEHRVENGRWGRGVEVLNDGTFEAVDLEIRDTHTDGIAIFGSEATLEDVRIHGTREEASTGSSGYGLGVTGDSHVVANNLLVEDNMSAGIQVGVNSSLVLSNSVVTDTLPDPLSGEFGSGLDVFGNSSVLVEGLELLRNHQAGAKVILSEATLRDLHVADTRPLEDAPDAGWGLDVYESTVTLERAALDGNIGLGIRMFNSSLVAEDVEIENTLPADSAQDTLHDGWGVLSQMSQAQFTNLAIRGVQAVGVMGDGGTVALDNAVIVDVADSSRPTLRGLGVALVEGAQLTATNLRIESTRGPGIFSPAGTEMSCSSCSVIDSRFASVVGLGDIELLESRLEGATAHPDFGGGVGVAGRNSQILVRDSELIGHELAGLWVEDNGSYQLHDSVVSGPGEYGLVVLGGLSGWEDLEGVYVGGNSIGPHSVAGVFVQESLLSLDGNTWEGNDVDLHVQGCLGLAPPDLSLEPALEVNLCPSPWFELQPLTAPWLL